MKEQKTVHHEIEGRVFIERRRFQYSKHIPERRSNPNGKDIPQLNRTADTLE
jgi:hypothetical protein